jgi:hypothetical protein
VPQNNRCIFIWVLFSWILRQYKTNNIIIASPTLTKLVFIRKLRPKRFFYKIDSRWPLLQPCQPPLPPSRRCKNR